MGRNVRRGPHRTTVALVASVVGALLLGSASGAVGASLVTSKQIKDGTIRAVDIRNNTITSQKIKNGTLVGKDVKDSSLTGKDVKDSSLTGSDVKDGSLTGADIKDGSLTGADIKDGSIGAKDLGADAVGTDALAPGAVTSEALAPGAVTSEALAEGAVTEDALALEARTYWALVDELGTVVKGDALGAKATSDGNYRVTFPVDVTACGLGATLQLPTTGLQELGFIAVNHAVDKADVVHVRTTDQDGAHTRRAFWVTVTC